MSKQAARVREKLVGLMTVSEFAEVLQMSTATARRCLDKATSEGIAVCHKAATPTEPDRFELSETAKRSKEPNFAYLAEVNENNKR